MQKSSLPRFIIGLFATGLVSCSSMQMGGKAKFQTLPFIGNFEVARGQLKNGLKVIILKDASSPTLAYQTWYHVGSRDELVGYTGLAHLFEHMMFKGTKKYADGQLAELLKKNGVEGLNAYTTRDKTVYIQELPKTKLDLISNLESDRMVNLIVDDQTFKTEREVVQNERRFRYENSPDGTLYQEIFTLAYKTNNYRWPVIGYEEDLNRMNAAEARVFYKTHYKPSRATIVVVGDVDVESTFSMIEKKYGGLSSAADQVVPNAKEPVQTEIKRKKVPIASAVQKLVMAYHVPELNHPDMPALTVLNALLSSGKNSRLNRALVDKGIASSVGVYDLDEEDPMLFIFAADLQKGKDARLAEKAILDVIADIQRNGVTQAEMDRAKSLAQFGLYSQLQTNYGKAQFLGFYETVLGDFQKGLDFFKHCNSVTPPEVKAVALTYFKDKNRSVVYGVQK